MNRFGSVWLPVLATLFVAQASHAMSKQQKLQVDVLVLDATMTLAKMGAAGGRFAAKEMSPGWEEMPQGTPNADTVYVAKVSSAADRAALAYCPTCDALKGVSKENYKGFERFIPFATQINGHQIAREAANSLAQSRHPDTWGPDLLWNLTTEAARAAIKRGESEEEIGRAAAKVAWDYVINKSSQIGDAVRGQVDSNYLADKFDANQVLTSLKKSMDSDEFKQGLPEAQNFYKASVAKLEQKMKHQHLIAP